jgi:hypothetical protein
VKWFVSWMKKVLGSRSFDVAMFRYPCAFMDLI